MKKLLVLLFAICCSAFQNIQAQKKIERDYNFHYISHDRATPVNKLSSALQSAYDDAVEYDNIAVFYLANGSSPMIVRVNTPDDNRGDFPRLIGQLQEVISHDVDAYSDVDSIMSFLETHPFAESDGHLRYQSVNWKYFVSSIFWTMGYNEALIATLYWALDMKRISHNEEFALYVVTDDDIEAVSQHNAMGDKNYEDMNKDFVLISY